MSYLVPWLPKIVEATAEEIDKFGPNAARVRSFLDFFPTMSAEALNVASNVRRTTAGPLMDQVNEAKAVMDAAKRSQRLRHFFAVQDHDMKPYGNSAQAEVISDVLSPQQYKFMTNPIASGRAFDILRNRPRLQGTRFIDIAQQVAERGGITRPRDMVAVSRISQSGEDAIEIALALIADGMTAEDAMRAAKLLAQ